MSTWREYLNEKGEGIHHIAINVDNTEEAVKACEALGMKVVQRGFMMMRVVSTLIWMAVTSLSV